MIRRNSAADVIPWCAAHETGVIVYSPMQAGLLTEKMTAERVAKFPEDDWRRRTPEFQEPNLSRNLKLRDALRPIAERHQASNAEIAIAWVLSWPGVTGAIAGARSAAQVDGWIRAGQIVLTAQDLDEIARLIEQTGAGSGPTRAGTAQAAAKLRERSLTGPRGSGKKRDSRCPDREKDGAISELRDASGYRKGGGIQVSGVSG